MTESPKDDAAAEGPIREAHRRGDLSAAATLAVEQYGSEILGFLIAILKDETVGSDVFSQFCEDLWTGLGTFRWDCTFRTWAYTLARNASRRHLRSPHLRRNTGLSPQEVEEVAEQVRTVTAGYRKSDLKHGVHRLREALDDEDQALLILRVDRDLPWNDVARIMLDEEEGASSATSKAIAKKAAALRKRFERVKDELRKRALEQGLLEDR